MATEVARKGLNPDAPEFVPTNYKIIPHHVVDHNLYLPPSSIFSPPNTSFYYPSPSSLPYLPTTFPDPLFSQPFYPNSYPHQSSLLTPQQHTFLPSPSPPRVTAPQPIPVNETPPCLTMAEQNEVVAEKMNSRGIRRGSRNRGFWRREGFEAHDKRSKQEWKPVKVVDAEYQNFRMVRYSPPKKQQTAEMVPVEKDGNETTVMIRNIPNKYTRQMLLQFLEEHCSKENSNVGSENGGEAAEEHILSAFDFLYLPMDFKTGLNKSYAFVNFTDPRAVWKFHLATHNQKWELFHSSKIREIARAKIQKWELFHSSKMSKIAGAKIEGKEALIEHFKPSTFHCDSDDYLPVCFSPPMGGSREMVKQSLVGIRIPMHS